MALSDNELKQYFPRPDPVLDESKAIYLKNELRRISEAIMHLNKAVAAIITELDP